MKETAQDKVLILIPVFNEARSIRSLMLEIRGLYPDMDILVVDDGSSDNSAAEARAGGAIVISHCFNLGDGAARQTGFLYALRQGYNYIVHLDGDRQHSPEEIPRFLDILRGGQADLVVGSRFLGEHRYPITLSKRIGMKLFSTICTVVIRQKITDPTSGFRGMNRRAMEIYTRGYYPQHFPDADVIISSYFRGLRIKEIPVTVRETQSTSLHRGGTIIYYIYKMLLSTFVSSLRFSRLFRNKNPETVRETM
ncbi:MAG: glycosyltransferase family 2 protein [Candidatus Auribacterota bacterium]|nr:glycosyltransferase family 2 protein [Candidatus Auribacterota bacterium]